MTKERDTNANEIKAQPTQGDTTESLIDKAFRRKRTLNTDSSIDETGTTATNHAKVSPQQTKQLDELTSKLSQTEAELAEKTDTVHYSEANNIIKNHVIGGFALGLIPFPLLDIAALSSTQLNMLRNLSSHYRVSFDKDLGKSLVISLISGSLPVLTIIGLSSMFKLIPGIGTLGGSASLSLLAGAVTYATGQVFIKHFDQGGTLQDFDAGQFTRFFKQELAKGKTFVKGIQSKEAA